MKIITIASNKGGATKTTAAANLGFYLGTKASTLILDFDSQGQLALWFGKDPKSDIFDWWTGVKILENAVTAARPEGKLWLMLGDTRSKVIEKMYRSISQSNFDKFVKQIRDLGEFFEFVVIDTAPAGILQEVAVAAADDIIVPFVCATDGVDGAYGTLDMLQELQVKARISFLPSNFFDQIEPARCLNTLRAAVGPERVAEFPVLHRVAVTEALSYGQSVFEYGNSSLIPVRSAYAAICDHFFGPFGEEIEEGELIHEER